MRSELTVSHCLNHHGGRRALSSALLALLLLIGTGTRLATADPPTMVQLRLTTASISTLVGVRRIHSADFKRLYLKLSTRTSGDRFETDVGPNR